MGVYEKYSSMGLLKPNATSGGVYERTMRQFGITPTPEESIFTDKSINPKDWAAAGWEVEKETFIDTARRLKDVASSAADVHKSLLDRGIDVGEAGVGIVNALFLPITTSMATLSRVPVIGYGFDALNKVFEAVATVGSKGAGKAVDALPVSQETKDKVKPLAEEVGALVAQILAAKGAQLAFRKAKPVEVKKSTVPGEKPPTPPPTQTTTPHIEIAEKTQQIIELVKSDMQKTPAQKHLEYARKMGYEPYTSAEKLPTIKATAGTRTKKTTPTLPTIFSAARATKAKPTNLGRGVQLVPEKIPVEVPIEVPTRMERISRTQAEPSIAPKEEPLRRSGSTGEPNRTGISETSLKVQERAGEAGTDVPTDILSRIGPYNAALQSERFARFARENPDAAWKTYESLVKTVGDSPQAGIMQWELYKKAVKEGDVSSVMRLAESPVGTEFGRGLQSFNRANDLDINVVREIQDINRAGSRGIDVAKEANKVEYKPEKPSAEDMTDFLNKLPPEC